MPKFHSHVTFSPLVILVFDNKQLYNRAVTFLAKDSNSISGYGCKSFTKFKYLPVLIFKTREISYFLLHLIFQVHMLSSSNGLKCSQFFLYPMAKIQITDCNLKLRVPLKRLNWGLTGGGGGISKNFLHVFSIAGHPKFFVLKDLYLLV